jgi:hypothetical protein
MPIVCVGKFGYYTVEMLYQAEDRLRGAEVVKDALAFYDNSSGPDRVDHIQRAQELVSSLEKDGIDMKEKFGFNIIDDPEILSAKVIPPPKLKFRDSDASINNGS